MTIDADFLRTIDWSNTPLGPMDEWPRSLKSYVDMILALPTPAIIFWGPEQTQLYNDGYSMIMGPRHPHYFGKGYRESWPETYPMMIPWMHQVLADGRYFEVAREPITMTRHGFAEEAHFSFTFSPLRDDEGSIAGIYQPIVEMTELVLRDRRVEMIRLLASREDVLGCTETAFRTNPKDIPCAAIYLWDEDTLRLQLTVDIGFADRGACEAGLRPIQGMIAEVFAKNEPAEGLIEPLALGPWPEPVPAVFVAPLRHSVDGGPGGVIVFGISSRLRFDKPYRNFFESVAREIGHNLFSRRVAQAEREWRERDLATRREAAATYAGRLARVFEHAPVAIAVLRGPEHVFEVANPQYAALVSHRPVLQKPIRVALPELAGQGIYELLDRVYQTGIPYVGRALSLLLDRGNGVREERFFDFVYQPVPSSDGPIDSIIVVAFDVTELARARRHAERDSQPREG